MLRKFPLQLVPPLQLLHGLGRLPPELLSYCDCTATAACDGGLRPVRPRASGLEPKGSRE